MEVIWRSRKREGRRRGKSGEKPKARNNRIAPDRREEEEGEERRKEGRRQLSPPYHGLGRTQP